MALDGALRAGDLVAATAVLGGDGTSRALGAGERLEPDAGAHRRALRGDRSGLVASADVEHGGRRLAGALAFDLESAAVLAAAARAGIPAACLVAIEGAVDPDAWPSAWGAAALAGHRARARLTQSASGVRLARRPLGGGRLGRRRAQLGELLGDRVQRDLKRARGARRGGRRRPRCPPGAGRPTARAG